MRVEQTCYVTMIVRHGTAGSIILNQIFGKIERDICETLAPTGNLSSQANMLFISTTIPVGNVKRSSCSHMQPLSDGG